MPTDHYGHEPANLPVFSRCSSRGQGSGEDALHPLPDAGSWRTSAFRGNKKNSAAQLCALPATIDALLHRPYFAREMLKSSVPSVIRLRGVRHNNLKNFDLD